MRYSLTPRDSRASARYPERKSAGRSRVDSPPTRCSVRVASSRDSRNARVSSSRPRPTSFATILRSSSHSLAPGTRRVSTSRSCSSTTSTPRSRSLSTKSWWSRFAFCTHRTSSNSSASLLLGVRRSCPSPGRHTSTLRSVPTSEWTPYVTCDMDVSSGMGGSDLDRARREEHGSDDREDGDPDERREPRRGEQRRALLAAGGDVQQRGGSEQQAREEPEHVAGRPQEEQRVHRRDARDDELAGADPRRDVVVAVAPQRDLQRVGARERERREGEGRGEVEREVERVVDELHREEDDGDHDR